MASCPPGFTIRHSSTTCFVMSGTKTPRSTDYRIESASWIIEGFHRRGIDADSLALDQAMRGQTFEYPPGRGLRAEGGFWCGSTTSDPALPRTQTDVGTLAAKGCPRSAIPGHARCLCLQNNRSVACGSSDLAATTAGRDAAHIPSRIASQRTRRSPPRSAQLAAYRRISAHETSMSACRSRCRPRDIRHQPSSSDGQRIKPQPISSTGC